MTWTKPWTPSRDLATFVCLTLPLVISSASAQNSTPVSGPASSGAGSTLATPGAAVTVRPGRTSFVTPDLRTAVVGATETGGNVELARRALAAAAAAISVLPGYTTIPAGEVARGMQNLKKDALRVPEFQAMKKAIRADRALSVTLTPGTSSDAEAAYTAVVEMYDTTTGGLVGRTEETYSATADNAVPALPNEATTPGAAIERGALVQGSTGTVLERAVDGAIARAIFALNAPILQRGIVLNKNAFAGTTGAPLVARISLGERSGMRVGTPIVYFAPDGRQVAFGTIVDLGAGESLATIAPESAFSQIAINSEVRNTDNPPPARSGAPQRTQDEREWRQFERRFGVALVVALAISVALD